MNVKKWTATVASLGMSAMFAYSLSGCGGDDDADDAHDHADGDANHSHSDDDSTGGSATTGDSGGGDQEYSQLTPDTFQQLKDMLVLQIESVRTGADTLRQVEAEHNDQQLKDLIGQIDAKVHEAQTMLDEATVANGSKTLQIDIPKAIEQAGELTGRANERMTQVMQAKFGGGVGGGGGGDNS